MAGLFASGFLKREAFHKIGGHDRTGCPEVCGVAARAAAEIILDLKKDL